VHQERRSVWADGRRACLPQSLDETAHLGAIERTPAADRGAASETHEEPLSPGLAIRGIFVRQRKERRHELVRLAETVERTTGARSEDAGEHGGGAEEEGPTAEHLAVETKGGELGKTMGEGCHLRRSQFE
jgi:hypothetical protein